MHSMVEGASHAGGAEDFRSGKGAQARSEFAGSHPSRQTAWRATLPASAHPVGPYVLDFYCAEARLAVEVDGAHHDLPEQMSHDRRRDSWLGAQGIRVIRIAATDILDERALDGMLVMIAEAAGG